MPIGARTCPLHVVVQLTIAVAPPGLTVTDADLVEAETYAGRRATLEVVAGMLRRR